MDASLELAERLLEYAEDFAREGDPSAARTHARCALEGLDELDATRAGGDEALRSLLERARHELGLYEAQWSTWQRSNDERQADFASHEWLALKSSEVRPAPEREAPHR